MFFAVYAQSNNDDKRKLGVEINTKSSFYIPAAYGSKTITGLVKVGKSENASADDITGLKIAPKAENGKDFKCKSGVDALGKIKFVSEP